MMCDPSKGPSRITACAAVILAGLVLPVLPLSGQATAAALRTTTEVIEAASPSEWRTVDPANTVYLDLPGGRVIMELAPDFAPQHVNNVRKLVRAGAFNGGAVNRAQDNYVVQWGTSRSWPPGTNPD